MHFSAFFEIYKICILLHRSNLGNCENLHQEFADFCWNFAKIKQTFAKIRENPEIYAPKNCEKSANFEIWAVQKNAKECKSCRNIWFCLFFSPGAPKRLQTTHGPENAVSLLEKSLFRNTYVISIHHSSAKQEKSAKIEPRWLGKLPKVTRRLPQRYPNVTPR